VPLSGKRYADYARYTVGDVALLEIELGRVRLMTTRFVATIAAVIFAVLMATPGFTCTTLCLFEKGRALVAYNYDAWASEGLVLVNKRGTSKKGRAK
jgi:hypothetical protein